MADMTGAGSVSVTDNDVGFSVGIKDFRAIKTASLSFPSGVTLISAKNCSGKSTMIKALKCVLDGTIGDSENVRHGQSSFGIAIRYGNDTLTVRRVGKDTYIKYNDEPERSKLGRKSMDKLIPEFPLKRIEYDEFVFYPNFSFQGSVPIFGDIPVMELFSRMFASIAIVGGRVEEISAVISHNKTDIRRAEVLIESGKSSQVNLEKRISDFFTANNVSSLEGIENSLSSALKAQEVLSQRDSLASYVESIQDTYKRLSDLEEKYNSFSPLVKDVEFVDKVYSFFVCEEELKKLQDDLNRYGDIDVSLVSRGIEIDRLVSEIELLDKELSGVLVAIDDIRKSLPKTCEIYDNGLCPMSNIAVGNSN